MSGLLIMALLANCAQSLLVFVAVNPVDPQLSGIGECNSQRIGATGNHQTETGKQLFETGRWHHSISNPAQLPNINELPKGRPHRRAANLRVNGVSYELTI